MDTENPNDQQPQAPMQPWSDELTRVFEEYMAEYRTPAEFAQELVRVFPNDQAFINVKTALLNAMMPGDRGNVLHKSMNHLTILVAISTARSASQAVAQATATLQGELRKANEQVIALLKACSEAKVAPPAEAAN